MSFSPISDGLLVRPDDPETMSRGGIALVSGEKCGTAWGVVLALGPGFRQENGSLRAFQVRVGDRVAYGRYSGEMVKVNGEELRVVWERDVYLREEKA